MNVTGGIEMSSGMSDLFLVVVMSALCVAAQSKSPKRGICGDASDKDLAVIAPYVTWYYNWSIEPPAMSKGALSGIEWVPMQWGSLSADKVTTTVSKIPAGSGYLLGFNEPNFQSQSNLTPAQAAASWPNVEKVAQERNLKLVSPAVNWCGGCVDGVTNDPTDWLDKFIAACPDCSFDYIAVHNYNSYLSALKSYVGKFKKYGKPVWLTEFASWDDPVDYLGVVRYMTEAIPWLESEPTVFRYSWFATRVGSNHDLDLFGSDGELTKLGQLYAMLSFEGDTGTTDNPPLALLPSGMSVNIPAGEDRAAAALSGATYDRNGDSVTVEWSQVSGPATADFTKKTVTNPTVSGLKAGAYTFQMTARANGKSDSALITVDVSPPNIAKGKPVTASSAQGDNAAAKVNDGKMDTRWSSLDSEPQWITIDLGELYVISGVKLVWEAAHAKEYSIDVSENGTGWKTVWSTKDGAGGTESVTVNAVGRYVRMNSVKRANTSQYWGNSIYEFEVYGTVASSAGNHRPYDDVHLRMDVGVTGQYLTVKSSRLRDTFRVAVVDCTGKVVCSRTVSLKSGGTNIAISGMKSGTYLVAVNNGGRMLIKRMVLVW